MSTKIDASKTIYEYIDNTDWRVKANSNTSYSNAGLINNTAGKVIANFWLDEVYDKDTAKAHRDADLHIHDLDCLSGYCAGWSLRALLNEGFNGVAGRVDSKAPMHFRTALSQMANFLGILQSEWAGAQAFSSFDTYLAPYLFKDGLTDKELTKALTSFVYNLNVPARWGQSPFTNITLDIDCPDDLKEQIPTSKNQHLFTNITNKKLTLKANERGRAKLTDMTYGDFKDERARIVKALYNVLTKGDANSAPFTFPIPTINLTESFDWDSDVAQAIFENTAKIGSSYFQNFIGSQYLVKNGEKVPDPDAYKPGAVRSMCCRLQLDLRELLRRGGGLFGSAEQTGSIGVVTINLARLGYLYKGDKDALFKRLDELLDIAKNSLEAKREFITQMFKRGLYPYTARYLRDFNNHFSTIGVNGANEMIRNFSDDKENIASEFGREFGIEILEHIRTKLREFQSQTGHLYNLEATPAEGTTYRFAKEDLKRYSGIIQAGLGDGVYYTNSTQLPVDFTDDPFLALSLQDELQTAYTGGTTMHLYMRERLSSAEAAKSLVRACVSNFRLPYLTITPIFSICPVCGYIHGEQQECPKCGEATLTYTRVMGYHRPVSSFNIGKKAEHDQRVSFNEPAR
ncbi:anaerobic ribonucleoside triphosphate reductase [Campylobacter sp. 19-13652]|nr:anaerobic ribonucleoside triphosphate reductase [Campylobacter sp. 19-13652]